MAVEICRRLRMSREQIDRISWMVSKHMIFRHVQEMRPSKLKRLMGHEAFPGLEKLHRADAIGSNLNLSALEFIEEVRQTTPEVRPDPLLHGRDLIELGLKPGPVFGEILRAAYDAQLEGAVHTRGEALEFARRRTGNA